MIESESEELLRAADEALQPNQRTFCAIVAYDGTRYGGWQRQINSLSIQQCVEDAIQAAVNETCRTLASGRTDAGVHAHGQVIRFRTTKWAHEDYKLIAAINRHLPRDIAIQQVREATSTFNPMRDAISKTYRYTIRWSRCPDPFDERVAWFLPRRLDYDVLMESAAYLVGKHDFASFETLGSPRSSTVRTMYRLDGSDNPRGSVNMFTWILKRMVSCITWFGTSRALWSQLLRELYQPE